MQDDPRWDWITAERATCACCGRPFARLLSPGYSAPGPYPHGTVGRCENHELPYAVGDILTEDFCIYGKHRFVRGSIEFPLRGTEKALVIGVWSSLSKPNFQRYSDSFDSGEQAHLGRMSSWLSNPVPISETKPIGVWLHPQDDRQRPKLRIGQEDHPLFALQRDGLDFDTFAEWMDGFGHKVRPKLDS